MPGNPGKLGLGAVATTLAMVSQVLCTDVRVRAGWKVGVLRACSRGVGKAEAGAAGKVIACFSLFSVVPAWWACVGACLSGGPFLVLNWDSHRSLSACTCKKATEDARALLLSRI